MQQILEEKGLEFFHAIQYNDFKTYCAQKGILSRKKLAENNTYYTRFFSDAKDVELNCWDRTFGNFSDLGNGFTYFDYSVPNAYGPISLIYKKTVWSELSDLQITKISIAQRNYQSSKHDLTKDTIDNYFEYAEKYNKWYPKKGNAALEISSSNELISFDYLKSILVDPIIFNDLKLIDLVRKTLDENGFTQITVKERTFSKNNTVKQNTLNQLTSWSSSLHGRLLHRNEDLKDSLPNSLTNWFEKLPTVGKSILASWLTYTYNGTLLYMQEEKSSFNKYNISYSSRYEHSWEIKELEDFIIELEKENVAQYVDEIFYDSKASLCSFVIEESVQNTNEEKIIINCAEKTISQFMTEDGCVYHGAPLDGYLEELEF